MRTSTLKIGLISLFFLLPAGIIPAQAAPPSDGSLEMETWTKSLNSLESTMQSIEGYGGISMVGESSAVVYVKESSPAAAVALPEYEELSVEVKHVPYSLKELVDERDRLTAQAAAAASPVAEIIPNAVAGGIEITVSAADAAGTTKRSVSGDPLGELGLSTSGIPISLTYSGTSPETTSRMNTNPTGNQIIHEGGQRIVNVSASINCTGGIPVFDTKLLRHSVLTAGHCGSNGNIFRDGTGKSYGTMYGDLFSLDPGPASYDYALLQNVAGAINVGSIARGPVYSTTGSFPSGSFNAQPGSPRLCASGSFNGEVCDLGVLSTNMNVFYAGEGWAYGVTKVRSFGTYSGWGKGDSGGPVFRANSNGTVTVAGIISGANGGSPQKPCKEHAATRTCQTDLYFAPFNLIRDLKGLTISQGM